MSQAWEDQKLALKAEAANANLSADKLSQIPDWFADGWKAARKARYMPSASAIRASLYVRQQIKKNAASPKLTF